MPSTTNYQFTIFNYEFASFRHQIPNSRADALPQVPRIRRGARYWQENGIRIYVDLNVSSKFFEYNRMGVPDGWNVFSTRGAMGGLELLKAKFNQARQISGLDSPNLIVYGGGREIHEYCMEYSLLYVTDFMSEKGDRDNG